MTRVPGTEDRYTFDWTGPWTYEPTPGTVLRMPAGNYKLVVAGKRQGSETEIRSDPPYEKVSLVEVKQLELAQCGSIPGISCQDGGALLTNNEGGGGTPMPGGGKAAFPDATQPGTDFRRTILMRAELEPNLGEDAGQVTVHFRSVDVDDPSASAAGSPIDDDSVATTSTDNRNENSLIVPSVTASPDQGGAAISYFRASTQQGNNYRLAASTHESIHDAAIMCAAINVQDNTIGGTITPQHISLLRSTEEPTPTTNNSPCP